MQRATIFSSLRLGRWRLPCAYESNEIMGTFVNEVHSPESTTATRQATSHCLPMCITIIYYSHHVSFFGRLEREENETTRPIIFDKISVTTFHLRERIHNRERRTLHSRYESRHCTNMASTCIMIEESASQK